MTAYDSKEKGDVSMGSTDLGNVSKSAAEVDICGLAIKSSGDRQMERWNRQMEQNARHQDPDDA